MHCSGWTRKLSLWEGDDRDHEASHVGFEHSKDEQRLLSKLAVVQWVAGNFEKMSPLHHYSPKRSIQKWPGAGAPLFFFFPHLDPKGVVTQSYGPVVHLVGEA